MSDPVHVDRAEAEFERRRRRALVAGEWLAGASVGQIAHDHDMSVHAVRHIIDTTPGLRQEHAERLATQERERITRLRRQLHAWSHAHPGVPASAAADRYGLTTTQVLDLLGDRAVLHTGRGATPHISDQQILDTIRAHIAATGDLRAATYTTAAQANGWPSLSTITGRHGTWRNALTAAGIPTPAGHGRHRVWSDDQLIALVRDYLQHATRPGWKDLAAWLKEDPTRPSIALVRQRLGTWGALITATTTPHDR